MDDGITSPHLPLPVSLGLAVLMLWGLTLVMRRVPDWNTRFLMLAIMVRYLMSALPQFTNMRILPGISFNAFGSITIIAIGLLLLPTRRFLTKAILPVYLVIIVVALSGALNHLVIDSVDTILKWMYFGVLFLLLLVAAERHGSSRLARILVPSFLPPLVFQAASIALGVAKAAEADGSVSYIGGYHHEFGMSTALLGLLFVVSLARFTTPVVKPGLVLAASAGIVLANYRTALLSAAPLAASALTAQSIRAFTPRQRALVTLLIVPVAALLVVFVASSFAERMADIGTLASNWQQLLKPPSGFTVEQRQLFSGRLYIWSGYISTYLTGNQVNLLFGRGPDSWEDFFDLYAHNTVVSYLFEFGIFGVIALLTVWGYFLSRALMVRGEFRVELLAGHLSFLILNMSTMPHWLIEGNIFYAMVCGFTIDAYRRTVATREAPRGRTTPVRRPVGLGRPAGRPGMLRHGERLGDMARMR